MKKVIINNTEYILGDASIFESGTAYTIEGKDYPASKCEYDFAKNIYILKESDSMTNLVKGIVGIDKDNNFIQGYFSPSLSNSRIQLKGGDTLAIMDPKILDLEDSEYVLSNNNTYVHVSVVKIKNLYEPFKINKDFKTTFPYGAGDVMDQYEEYFQKVNMKISQGANKIHGLLGGLSVGVEFETATGLLSKKECHSNGLIPLRDGSIDGLEYVTIPLKDVKGIQALINSVNLLKNKANVDQKCALHYHYGNIPRTKEFIVSFWITMTMLQDDLFRYQLAYKKDDRGFKTKDYSKPLPNLLRKFDKVLTGESLTKAYDVIIEYLSMGLYGSGTMPSLEDINSHPADPNGTQKWHIKTRYYMANLIPLIFCNKKTVEFRHHDVSLNPNLVINEMVINALILRFVLDNQENILKGQITFDLYNIIRKYSNDKDYDNLLYFLEQKRSDVCNAFKNGENFKDFTNNNYASLIKQVITNCEIDKNFEIEFHSKYFKNELRDVRGNGRNPAFINIDDLARRPNAPYNVEWNKRVVFYNNNSFTTINVDNKLKIQSFNSISGRTVSSLIRSVQLNDYLTFNSLFLNLLDLYLINININSEVDRETIATNILLDIAMLPENMKIKRIKSLSFHLLFAGSEHFRNFVRNHEETFFICTRPNHSLIPSRKIVRFRAGDRPIAQVNYNNNNNNLQVFVIPEVTVNDTYAINNPVINDIKDYLYDQYFIELLTDENRTLRINRNCLEGKFHMMNDVIYHMNEDTHLMIRTSNQAQVNDNVMHSFYSQHTQSSMELLSTFGGNPEEIAVLVMFNSKYFV